MIKIVLAAAALTIGASYLAAGLVPKSSPQALKPLAPAVEQPGSVTLRADDDGHFRVDATIGGRRVPMLVDTGATVVALSFEQAQSLGLIAGGDRFDLRVSTANGQVGARRVILRDLRIGSVSLPDVAAVVLARGAMDGNLLGMSFLGRLKRMESKGDRLVLER